MSSQSNLHEPFPDMEVHMTECSGEGWSGPWESNFLENMRQLFIGNVNNFGQSTRMLVHAAMAVIAAATVVGWSPSLAGQQPRTTLRET